MQYIKSSANITGSIIWIIVNIVWDIFMLLSWGILAFLFGAIFTVLFIVQAIVLYTRHSISVGDAGVMGKGSGVPFQLEYNQISSVGVGEGSDAKSIVIASGNVSYNVKVNKAAQVAAIIQNNMEQLGIRPTAPVVEAQIPVMETPQSTQVNFCGNCGAAKDGLTCEYCNQ